MKFSKQLFSGLIAATMLALVFIAAPLTEANAATPNYLSKTEMIPFHISGQYGATTTNVVKFALPYSAKLIGATATARASGGTSPTLTVDVKSGGTTVLSAPIAVTAGTVAEGVITSPNIGDEAVVTVDLTIGGTSPTWNDITVLLTVVRR